MGIPVSSDNFLELVLKSGVVEASTWALYLQNLASHPSQPQQWANRLVADGVLTPFQAKHLLAGRYKGLVLGQYKILDQIGKGGTGVVFLAEHSRLRRQVAIKVLPIERSRDFETLERFYREARAVALLDHPNIVRAHDANHAGNVHYLVMEFVEGQSLLEYVQKHGPVAHAQAASYICQAAMGLQHAHERGMVHRDIKPGNLLLDKTGTIKILDMGLVRFFQEQDDLLTKDYCKGAVLGTADYLSPEQAMNCSGVDIRADIYSLGATFYTLLVGQPPFHEDRLTQKLIAHQLKEPVPVHKVKPDIPEGLSKIVSKMMAKKPEERYQTPAEVADALIPWASSLTATLPEHTFPTAKVPGKADELVRQLQELERKEQEQPTTKSPVTRTHRNRRRELLVAGLALCAATLMGALLFWYVQNRSGLFTPASSSQSHSFVPK